MTSFTDLGAPFPLFEAPVDDAVEFVGSGTCALCGQGSAACFELGIGCAVMQECSACGTVNGLDASDAKSVDCRACQRLIAFRDHSRRPLALLLQGADGLRRSVVSRPVHAAGP